MTRGRQWIVAAAVLSAALSVGLAATAQDSSARFEGLVSIDGADALPGSTLVALVNNTACGSTTVLPGASGSAYVLDVPGDCAGEGDVVFFQMDGYLANQTGTWRSGGLDNLDLSIRTAVVRPEPPKPDGPATVTIEVTVWRRIANPALLYISTRAEGGNWHTLDTALDMTALSSSRRFHQSNAIPVEVTLSTGAVSVDITVWRRVSNPSVLYISTRPEGGNWHTLDTALDMTALSSSGRFHQSNTVSVDIPLREDAQPDTVVTPAPTGPIHVPGSGTSLNEATGDITTRVTIRGTRSYSSSASAKTVRFACYVGTSGTTWFSGTYDVYAFSSGFYYQIDGGEWAFRRVRVNSYDVPNIDDAHGFWNELVEGDSLRIGADSELYSIYNISWLRNLEYRWNMDHCGEY